MKKVLGGIAGILVLGLVGVAGAAMTQPDVVHVERSVTMSATVGDVFPLANDYTQFAKWMPWAELDPNQTVTISDPPAGVDAWYAWKGNSDVGSGKMTHTGVIENAEIKQHLEFFEPFESEAEVTFTFVPVNDGVAVTWAFDQQADFPSKVMGLFMDMDAMLGADFERGLSKLQPLAEAQAVARAETHRLAALEAEKQAADLAAEEAATASAE